MKTTLLIMAAGIGSRFGTGIKQLEPVDDTPVFDIFRIKFYYFFKVCNITSSAYLPHSCNTWFHCDSGAMMEIIFFIL